MNRNLYSERYPHGRDGIIGVLVGRYGSEIWMKKTPFFSFGSWESRVLFSLIAKGTGIRKEEERIMLISLSRRAMRAISSMLFSRT
jgi:hypothetical protein